MKFQVKQCVEILSQTPVTVKSLLGDLSDGWTKSEMNREDWTPFDVVGHLIHADETDWIPRAEIILSGGDENSTFEPFDRYAMFEKSKDKTLSELIENFAAVRTESLAKLQAMDLNEEKLKLKGTHPELGAVTLEQLIATWTVHDLTHIRQIVTVLANKYAENVGVWKQYLSILK